MLLGLQEGGHELADLCDLSAIRQRAQCLRPGHAGANVVHGPPEFIGQRSIARRCHSCDRCIESQARFDTDGHLVDHVGCVGLHTVLALVTHAEHPVVGQEEQHPSGDDRQPHMTVDEQGHRRHRRQCDLDAQQAGEVDPVRMSSLHEVHFEAVDQRIGKHSPRRRAELSHAVDQCRRLRLRVGKSRVEVAASRRWSGGHTPPQHADGGDQCERSEDECDFHVFTPSIRERPS